MKVKMDDSHRRKLLIHHWKQKIKYAFRRNFICGVRGGECGVCRDVGVCNRMNTEPWFPFGKL